MHNASLSAASQLAASGRFGKGIGNFGPETDEAVRDLKVERTPALDAMMEAWVKTRFLPGVVVALAKPGSRFGLIDPRMEYYKDFSRAVGGLRYDAGDIGRFCVALAASMDEKEFAVRAGVALSVLMNRGPSSEYAICADHLAGRVDSIGYLNTKKVMIVGSVGKDCGMRMKGGSILVRGDAGEYAGMDMEGGLLTIEGYLGACLAPGMKGGEIHIQHDYSHCNREGGRIFLKGVQVWPMRDELK